MTSATSGISGTGDRRPAARRRVRRWLYLMVATAAAAAGLWYGWRWYTTPVPPELPGGVTDPAVIEVVEEARREVLRIAVAAREGHNGGDQTGL